MPGESDHEFTGLLMDFMTDEDIDEVFGGMRRSSRPFIRYGARTALAGEVQVHENVQRTDESIPKKEETS